MEDEALSVNVFQGKQVDLAHDTSISSRGMPGPSTAGITVWGISFRTGTS